MAAVIKSFMGIFFMILTFVVGGSVISMGVEEQAAQNFHADIISEIESSNFSPSVIQACINQAEREGYELSVRKIVSDEENNVQMAEVLLKYAYDIDIFHITSEHEKRGFAR